MPAAFFELRAKWQPLSLPDLAVFHAPGAEAFARH
jgi:hypothetical protein